MAGLRPSTSRAALERRRRIVDAVRGLLRERTLDDISAADVAAAAEVSPATVYNLVGTRDALIVAMLEQSVGTVLAGLPPVDPQRPVDAVVDLVDRIATELRADPIANRRAIAAMGSAGADGWLDTSLGDLIEDRLAACPAALDGRSTTSHTARMMHFGLRGVLVSWSYGHVTDDELGVVLVDVVLRLFSTSASNDVAAAIRDRLPAA